MKNRSSLFNNHTLLIIKDHTLKKNIDFSMKNITYLHSLSNVYLEGCLLSISTVSPGHSTFLGACGMLCFFLAMFTSTCLSSHDLF